MIVRTALDARALTDLLQSTPSRRTRSTHENVTRYLREAGYLVLANESDGDDLMAAIKQDPWVGTLWIATLKALHQSNRIRTILPRSEQSTSQMLEGVSASALTDRADVVVARDDVVAQRGFEFDGYGQALGEPEVTAMDSVGRCNSYRRVFDLRDRGHFPSGTPRDLVWAEVFLPLARVSTEVTILDRYLFKGLVVSRAPLSHLRWLLDRLGRAMPPNGHVKVMAEHPNPEWTESEMDRALRAKLWTGANGDGRSLEVWVAQWTNTNGRGAHNRHIRFSCGSAIGVTEGFDRLASDKISGLDGFTFKHNADPTVLHTMAEAERFVRDSGTCFSFL